MGSVGVKTREWLLDNDLRTLRAVRDWVILFFFFSQLSSSCYIAELTSASYALGSSGIAASRVIAR